MSVPVRRQMTLAELLDYRGSGDDVSVCGVTADSRRVEPGFAFLAIAGERDDGRRFIADAIARGSVAIVVEDDATPVAAAVPVVRYRNLAAALGAIAARFYGDPSARIPVVGVTGTNGKSTVTHLVAGLLTALGRRAGVIGTLGVGAPGSLVPTGLTTPDAVTLQASLAALVDDGCEVAAVEVSSHALAQQRVAGTHFELAVFTNLSRDHLDYHGDMARYGRAKAALFERPKLGAAIINIDDPFGRELADKLRGQVTVVTCGMDGTAAIRASGLQYGIDGVRGRLHAGDVSVPFHSPLLGEFNVANLLVAFAAVCQLGHPPADVAAAATTLHAPPGRMEIVPADDLLVIVDYAHTPDALRHVLAALRCHVDRQLWVIFGCGGERDRGKRAEMGAIAAALADRVVVTSDNPRGEAPDAIIDEIVAGMPVAGGAVIEPDRAVAITLAVTGAGAGDGIVIAGKGHEDYQEVAGHRRPFSDTAWARQALAERVRAS